MAAEDYADANTPDAEFSYADPLARLVEITSGTDTTDYHYYPIDGTTPGAGRLHEVAGPWADDTLAYTYDWSDTLKVSEIKPDVVGPALRKEEVTIDSLGRVSAVENDLGTFTWTYPSAGPRPSGLTGPGGLNVDYTYFGSSSNPGNQNLLESLTNQIGTTEISSFTYAYDASSRITEWGQKQTSPLETWQLGYNRDSELVEAQKVNGSSTVLEDLAWTYDPVGNRLVDNDGTTAMTAFFNNLNQIQRLGGAGQTLIEGTVDKPANVTVDDEPATLTAMPGTTAVRFTKLVDITEGTNTVEIEATDADQNTQTDTWQFTVPAIQSTFTYDNDGNTLTDGSRTYTWDAKNRLKSATIGGTVYSWKYDALDRRIEESIDGVLAKRFIWDGTDLVQERDASGAVTRTFFRSGLKTPSATYVYTVDHLGSIRELIDTATDTVAATYQYDLWGYRTKLSGTADTPAGYTGHYTHEPTGLVLTLYRAYDPELGRWLSRDPIESVTGEMAELLPEGPNLYSYGANNPVNVIDTLGLDVEYLLDTDNVAAAGQGHAACLVGNDKTGWDYYSFGPGGNLLTSGDNMTHTRYPTRADAVKDLGGQYEKSLGYSTDFAADQAARKQALKHCNYSGRLT